MNEIDQKLLENIEQELGIEPLRFFIGFTEKQRGALEREGGVNFVIAARAGIPADAIKEGEDPLQVGESILNIRVVELKNGQHLVHIESLKRDVIRPIKREERVARAGRDGCPCGNQPILTPPPPHCPGTFRFG